MPTAESRPLPLLRVLPWWPALLLAVALTAAATAAARGAFDDWLSLGAFGEALTWLADPWLAVALALTLLLFFGALIDLGALGRWRREVANTEADDADRDGWVYSAYKTTIEGMGARRDLDDIHQALQRHRERLASRVTQGWLLKYYLACFGMPLGSLVVGALRLPKPDGPVPWFESFAPLLVATLGPLLALGLALLVARHAKLTLEMWEDKARQIASAKYLDPAPPRAGPALGFRQAQLELAGHEVELKTEVVLSEPVRQDVRALLRVHGNTYPGVIDASEEEEVIVPAGQKVAMLKWRLHGGHAEANGAALELELCDVENARLGAVSRQAVRWRANGRAEPPARVPQSVVTRPVVTPQPQPTPAAPPPAVEPQTEAPFDPDAEYGS